MIFGDLTSWFLVILNESQKRSSKMFHFNMMILYDIWWFFVTFDDYWWFFVIKTGDLSWLIMIYHDWSWQITIQLGEAAPCIASILKWKNKKNINNTPSRIKICFSAGNVSVMNTQCDLIQVDTSQSSSEGQDLNYASFSHISIFAVFLISVRL